MKNARLILAAVIVAAAFAGAVYIHQMTNQPASNAPFNIFDKGAGSEASRRDAWQDPLAVIVAVAGLASAAVIVRMRH